MAVNHAFTSAKDDCTDTTLINPSDWNADHTFGTGQEVRASGTKTLAGKTATVDFTDEGFENEPDTNYYIQLTGDADENFFYSGKAVTEFVINSSWSGSTANVDWVITR